MLIFGIDIISTTINHSVIITKALNGRYSFLTALLDIGLYVDVNVGLKAHINILPYSPSKPLKLVSQCFQVSHVIPLTFRHNN